MRVLVTGGAGFIGFNLSRGIDCVVFDWRGRPGAVTAPYVQGDVRKTGDLEKCSRLDVDAVVHLAAIPGHKACIEHPRLAREVNVEGTRNVLEFCRRHGLRKMVFASSISVYGRLEGLVTEEHPLSPSGPYPRMKVEGEGLCNEYSSKYGIGCVVLRMSNVYGLGFPLKRNLTVVHRFLLNALKGEALKVEGSGDESRDFVNVSDVCQAFRRALDSDVRSEVYNVGSEETTSINRLAEIVKEGMRELYGQEIGMTYVPFPEWREKIGERFRISIKKAREQLGYGPEIRLREGIGQLLMRLV